MSSTTTCDEMRDVYLHHVDALYDKARLWTDRLNPQAAFEEEHTTIKEEPVAPYPAKILVIKRPDYKTVRLIPRGRWIIGAEGRVDLKSDLGTETLVYVDGEASTIHIDQLTESGKVLEERAPHSHPADVADGWVFVQNRQLGMLPALDAHLFRRLLEVLGR